jgi:zinc finger protein 423
MTTQPQSRVIRQTIYASQVQSTFKCFICDENIISAPSVLKESETSTSREKVTKKLARLVGDEFCVIVSEEDVICRRCLTLFNTMDKYEYDLDNVRNRLRGFINKKYGIEESEEPPVKIQRLSDQTSINRWQNNIDDTTVRKITPAVAAAAASKETAESQLKNLTNIKRGPVKLYKCIACDFKTTDLNAFQPHSSVCKGQQTKTNQITSQSVTSRVVNRTVQDQKTTVFKTNANNSTTQVGRTTIVRNSTVPTVPQLSCSQCEFKTTDRQLYSEHQRNHLKLRPFKCRMCLERFATRDAAQTHARIHSGSLKCGICNRQFVKKDVFEAHMKTHEKFKSVSQQEVIVMNKSNEIQKPLTDIIKEALSEEDQDAVNELIEFHSCNLCSLTFVNKKLYAQHMKTHESPSGKSNDEQQTVYSKGKSQDTMGDLERIFEKMHSETGHVTTSNGSISDSKNVLITTQESGGITYNITIPQDDEIPHVVEVMKKLSY